MVDDRDRHQDDRQDDRHRHRGHRHRVLRHRRHQDAARQRQSLRDGVRDRVLQEQDRGHRGRAEEGWVCLCEIAVGRAAAESADR